MEIIRTNLGSTIVFREDKGLFQEMYICPAALKDGFKSGAEIWYALMDAG